MILSLLAIAGPIRAQDAAGLEPSRVLAVELARRGETNRALEMLGVARSGAPHDRGLLHEEIVILGWAERDDEVLARAEALELGRVPVHVLTAVAKAARNLRRFDEAARWYERALEGDPRALDARVGLAMTHADRADHARAAETLQSARPQHAGRPDFLLARAYLAERAGRTLEALVLYEEVLAEAPAQREALRGKALALRALLLPREALELARAHPGILSEAEMARLEADEPALRLRRVMLTHYPPGRRRGKHEGAVGEIERALEQSDDASAASALRGDLVVALFEAGHADDAIAAFEALGRSVDQVSAYVVAAAGRAHLDRRRPARAVALLGEAHARVPDDLEIAFDLVFAYLAAERHAEALELARALPARLPLHNAAPGSGVVKANEARLEAEIVAGVAEAYADQLAAAQSRFERLLAAAPHHPDLRHELAGVYRWRGWLDRALLEYRRVLTSYPDLLSARVGLTHAQLDAAEFAEAAQRVAELEALHSEEPAVEDLAERWRRHERGELRLSSSQGESSGATFGSRQRRSRVGWSSRPFAHSFRALVRIDEVEADFPEGRGRLRRAGAGVEYRGRLWQATGLVSEQVHGNGEAGLLASSDRRFGDRWRLGGSLDLNSDQMPLRGHRNGVDADLGEVRAAFRPNESAALALGWRQARYSDGNAASSWFVDASRRVVNRPAWKLDLTGELGVGRHRLDEAAYFSPRRDAGWLAGARHEWRLFRRYERSLVQRFGLGLGRYDQSGFSSGRIWRLDYALGLELGEALALDLGVERRRMVYDAGAELGTFVSLGLRARL